MSSTHEEQMGLAFSFSQLDWKGLAIDLEGLVDEMASMRAIENLLRDVNRQILFVETRRTVTVSTRKYKARKRRNRR